MVDFNEILKPKNKFSDKLNLIYNKIYEKIKLDFTPNNYNYTNLQVVCFPILYRIYLLNKDKIENIKDENLDSFVSYYIEDLNNNISTLVQLKTEMVEDNNDPEFLFCQKYSENFILDI